MKNYFPLVFLILLLFSCGKNENTVLEIKNDLLLKKELIYNSFDDAYLIVSEFNESRGGISNQEAFNRLLSIPIFKDVDKNDLIKSFDFIINKETPVIKYTDSQKDLLTKFHSLYVNYEAQIINYNTYVNKLILTGMKQSILKINFTEVFWSIMLLQCLIG